ncbi:hypothetical protein [Alicyclobacillus dauci]|uniref:CobW C-terminal domain-containing protein n=1 Tax=Alicyclobacillus dauci TaxID=1475485 RepID=A0ABY6Z5V9_9BACL|nr:hypothetical protein [Alicyclobacillus dauci]WAH38207.1 hypothetical protein NZD86_06905 [Alicyclobacillus dauci]
MLDEPCNQDDVVQTSFHMDIIPVRGHGNTVLIDFLRSCSFRNDIKWMGHFRTMIDHGTTNAWKVIIVTGTVDQVTTLVKEMSSAELQNVVLRLAEQNEHVHAALYQVWKEREREARLRKSVEWEPAG